MSKKERLKIYCGIPKNIIDEHTIYYESFDGEIANVVFEDSKYTTRGFRDSNTGLATNKVINIQMGNIDLLSGEFTIEFWMENLVSGCSNNEWGCVIGIGTKPYNEYNTASKIFSILNFSDREVGIYLKGFAELTRSPLVFRDEPTHIRITYNGIDTATLYVNGIKLCSRVLSAPDDFSEFIGNKDLYLFINTGHNHQINRNNCYISDFRLSNIDRGSNFYNLPKDFVDGKAIIKPRLGHQQVKCDPIYNQQTKDIISISNVNKPYIKCSRSSGNWTNGDTIKIKGFNNEVISGIIDTDTCLFNSLEPEPYQPSVSPATIRVDNVNGLVVGDTVYRVDKRGGYVHTGPFSIAEINTDTKTIKLNNPGGGTNLSNSYYFVEVTTSSSSPIVKTYDGTIVVGTWSNLGTNEATFTLGTNSSLTNQDLYITYSLNIQPGNSLLTELPYSIERVYDEFGNELKPVSEMLLRDDFSGKIPGDTKQCPNISKISVSTTLSAPNSFTQELKGIDYAKIIKKDLVGCSVTTTEASKIPQQLFSYDLVSIIENKIGEIPSDNKVAWIKANITRVDINVYAYGECSEGNYCQVYAYINNSTWTSNYINSVTSSTFSDTGFSIIDKNAFYTVNSTITDDGFCHLLVTTKPSNGSVASSIYIDNTSIDIKLRCDENFTTYCISERESRGTPCNPVLIQESTKLVKRLRPSNECFSLECLNYGYKTNHIDNLRGKTLAVQTDKLVSSNGTGSFISDRMKGDINYSDKIPVPTTSSFPYQFNNEPLTLKENDPLSNFSHTVKLPIARYWGGKQYVGVGDENTGIDNCGTMSAHFDTKGYNLYEFFGLLRLFNNELYLSVQCCKRFDGNKVLPSIGSIWSYKLPNRPLIK